VVQQQQQRGRAERETHAECNGSRGRRRLRRGCSKGNGALDGNLNGISRVAVRALLASIAWPTWRAREREGERESTVEIEWEPCVLPRDIVVWCASSGAHEHENKNDGSDDSCESRNLQIYLYNTVHSRPSE